MSNTGSAIAITEPEAYDKVLDNEALRHFCILGNASGIQCSVPRHIGKFTSQSKVSLIKKR